MADFTALVSHRQLWRVQFQISLVSMLEVLRPSGALHSPALVRRIHTAGLHLLFAQHNMHVMDVHYALASMLSA